MHQSQKIFRLPDPIVRVAQKGSFSSLIADKTTSKVIALATTFGHWKYFLNGFIIESFIRFFSQNFLGKIRQNENWKNED